MNPFTGQGKALPNNMWEKIVDDWLQGKEPTEIGKELKLDKQTVSSIVDNFVRKGHVEAGKGENKIRSARTDDLMMLSTTQSTASKHNPVFMAARSKGKWWKITSV